MIFKNYEWDLSDQPKILKKEDKKLLRKGHLKDYLKLIGSNLIYFPYLFIKYLINRNSKALSFELSASNFYGMCVNLDKGANQVKLINELGVKKLLIRVFLSDIKNLDKYYEFAKSFSEAKIVFNIIQSRAHIENKELLAKDIKKVFEKLSLISDEFIIANAINRIKWGFVSVEEYLDFYEVIFNLRNKYFKQIKLIGPSIIDFEYHYLIRILYSNKKIYFDKISMLLYVDRRGSPKNKQFFIFDLKEKLKFLYEIVKTSKLCSNDIYITEFNWPIINTAPYAPTSEKECVSLREHAKFMSEYYDIAKKSGVVESVFYHQLIAPGYGLIDNRDGLKKYPAFFEYSLKISIANINYLLNIEKKEKYDKITKLKVANINSKPVYLTEFLFAKQRSFIKDLKEHSKIDIYFYKLLPFVINKYYLILKNKENDRISYIVKIDNKRNLLILIENDLIISLFLVNNKNLYRQIKNKRFKIINQLGGTATPLIQNWPAGSCQKAFWRQADCIKLLYQNFLKKSN